MGNRTKITLAAAAVASLVAAAPARAAVSYDYGDAMANKLSVIASGVENKAAIIANNIENKIEMLSEMEIDKLDLEAFFDMTIEYMTNNIKDYLMRSTTVISGNIKQATQAEAQMKQVQDSREVSRRIGDAKRQGMREGANSASGCNVITGNLTTAGSHEANYAKTGAIGDLLDKFDYGVGGAASENGLTSALAARARANAVYCTEHDQKAGVCEAPADPKIQGAPTSATKSIFSGRTYEEPLAEATDLFINNVVNPVPQGPLPEGFAQTEHGLQIYNERLSNRARMSVAEHYLGEYASHRKKMDPDTSTGQVNIIGWSEAMAKNVVGYSKSGNNFPNGVSWTDWMELRSKSWFFNPEWMLRVERQNPAQNTKDMTIMLSYMIYQNWELYKLLEKNGVVNAVQLAVTNDLVRRTTTAQ